MAQWQAIGEQFIKYYYSIYDQSPEARSQLASLYQQSSYLTVEQDTKQGPAEIIPKLQSFPHMQHLVKSAQYQPTPQNSILVLVSGDCKLAGQENAIKFSEVFHLVAADASGSNFYIQNDIFSLNYG